MPQADSKSSSGQEHPQIAQTALYPSPYPQQIEDDTLDLYELWITLWNRKWLVLAVTVVVALGSFVYALKQHHVYRAEALLLPPNEKDIQSINLPRTQGKPGRVFELASKKITSEDVFIKFKQNLRKRTLHKKFIQENGLMEILAPNRNPKTKIGDIYKGFSQLFKIKDANGLTYLSVELHDAEIAAQWINNLIKFTDKKTIGMLVENSRNIIENQIRDIEYSIASKRQMVKQRREDQIKEIQRTILSKRKMAVFRRQDKIERYTEAAKTAKSLGIMTGLTQQTKLVESSSGGVTPMSSREKLLGNSPPIAQMNVDIATATTPLFFIGFDALNAELDNLNSRTDEDPFIPGLRDLQEQISILNSITSDDPFIEGLRDLQERLALLRSINFNQEKMSAVIVDQAAYPPSSPIKPKRRSIVLLGTVAGLFSGIFLAFLIEIVNNQRKKHSG